MSALRFKAQIAKRRLGLNPGPRLDLLVVVQEKKLFGIFTDGDLRRALKTHRAKLLELPISQLMTTSPTTIASGHLAVRAIKLMENRPSQISVLQVVDDRGKALGVIRLHDIVRKGVF